MKVANANSKKAYKPAKYNQVVRKKICWQHVQETHFANQPGSYQGSVCYTNIDEVEIYM